MLFAYVTFDAEGRLHRGRLEAPSAADAEAALAQQYLGTIALRPVRRGAGPWWARSLGGAAVPPVPVAFYCRQLASMLRVGVAITRALTIQADAVRHRTLKPVAQDIAQRVAQGSRVSDALAAHPRVFSPIVVRMLRGAEQVGQLEEGFQDAGDHIWQGYQTRRKIAGALAYPAGAILAMLGVGYFIVYQVFPKLATMYVAFGVKLPALTVETIAVTNWLLATGRWFALGGGAAVAAGVALLRTPRGRLWRDRLLLRVPVIGPIVQLGALTQCLRALRSGLHAALPLDEAVDLAAAAAGNRHYQLEIRAVAPQIVSGAGLAAPLRATRLFPPLVVQGLEVGEDTGTLDRTLAGLVAYYAEELDQRVKTVAEALNPILMGIAMVFVGFLLVSILLPSYYILGHIQPPG